MGDGLIKKGEGDVKVGMLSLGLKSDMSKKMLKKKFPAQLAWPSADQRRAVTFLSTGAVPAWDSVSPIGGSP